MCGIFGFAKTNSFQTSKQIDTLQKVFTNLAEESVIRGEDSTGISIINPNSRRTFKSIVASDKIVKHDTWQSNILDRINIDTTIAIGHVRLATHGEVTKRNAHPFEIGNVLGAHNGVIYNYNTLAKKYAKDIQVDSEVIFAYLNNMRDTDALEQLEGDYAISYVKDSNRTLHLARESSRPCSLAYWKKARILFWASTEDILRRSMNAAGLNLKIQSLHANKIYSFDTDRFGGRDAISLEEFKPKEKKDRGFKFNTSGYSHGNWYRGYYDSASYDDDINDSCTISTNEYLTAQEKCETCRQKYYLDELIDMGDNIAICYDCFDDVMECGWCGDFQYEVDMMPFNDGYTNTSMKICKTCEPSLKDRLMLPEATSIVEA